MDFVSASSYVLFSLHIININNYSYSEGKKHPVKGSLYVTFDLGTSNGQNVSTAE